MSTPEVIEMTPEQITLYQGIATKLDEQPFGQKQAYLKQVCEQIGVPLQSLYRNLEQVGYKSGKKTREDKGMTSVDLDDARLVCGIMFNTQRKNEKRLISCQNAIEMAFTNKQIKQKYNPSSLLRVAKMHGFHPDQQAKPTPHQNMASLHPNHVWQVDASIGTLFYLEKGGVQFFDESVHYKNKPQNIEKTRQHVCVRYVITDHYSGAIFVKYYSASGETQEILFDLLVTAFGKKDGFLMHGVPHMIVLDKGAANTAHSVTAFLNKMQVQNYAHGTGNSRAKGSVEKAQDIIERSFEGGLRLLKQKVQNADELNDLANRWQVHFNSNAIHSRFNGTRFGLWQTIREDELRIAPSRETMEMLFTSKPILRTVKGDLTITFRGKGFDEQKQYSVAHIPNVNVFDKVMVSINPYRSPNIDVIMTDYQGKETYHECVPLFVNEAGFLEGAAVFGEEMLRPADTKTDIERKAELRRAYAGAETLEQAKAQQKKGVQLYGGAIDPMAHIDQAKPVTFIDRAGTASSITAPQQILEPISIAEAAKRIKASMGADYPADGYSRLKNEFGDVVDPMGLDDIIATWTRLMHLKIIKTA